MKTAPTLLQRIAKYSLIGAMALVVVVMSGLAVPTAHAETDPPQTSPILPCGVPGSAPGVIPAQLECHAYDNLVAMNAKLQRSWQFTVGTAILNGLSYFTQRIAVDMADWVLTGFKGGGPSFYRKGWDGFLNDVALGSVNVMITSMAKSDFMQNELGINICQPISLNLKLSLGLNLKRTVFPDDCGYNVIARNFEETYRSLDPEKIPETLRNAVQRDSDIKIQLLSNQKFINQFLKDKESASLNRQEGRGFKLLTSLISNNIETPAQVMQNNLVAGNPLSMYLDSVGKSNTVLAAEAFQAGIEQLPMFAAGAFINTLAVGLIDKMFALFKDDGSSDGVDLLDINAQSSALTRSNRRGIVTDILTPNLISTDKVDLLFELTSCPTPRGTWGCSLDDSFAQALRSSTESGAYTVSRAAGIGTDSGPSSQVFLHPEWELIPESDAKENQDPSCYQRAYCASNLAKLRFARIIPAGWELAANSPYNKKVNGKYITLGEVIRNFNVCTNGQTSPTTPWCHMINPAWVLTAPSFRCEVRGFGDTLTLKDTAFRSQECSDVTTCLRRNDKGECIGGYGACLSERTVWRFGADACEERYASCRTYTSRDDGASKGKQVSYVRNTIDYGQCNAENVGCMFYATFARVGQPDNWFVDQSRTADSRGFRLSSPRIYFDSTVETCDASADGCTKVLKVVSGKSSLNLVANPSFERTETSALKLEHWGTEFPSFFTNQISLLFSSAATEWAYNVTPPAQGNAATDRAQGIRFPSDRSQYLHQRVDLAPLRNYVISGYARRADVTGAGRVQVGVHLQRRMGTATGNFRWPDGIITGNIDGRDYYRSTSCLTTASASLVAAWRSGLTDEWVRVTCEFVTPPEAQYGTVVIQGQNVIVDAVQLEEGSAATSFVDGIAPGLAVSHMKIAPTWLASLGGDRIGEATCTGDEATDPEECKNYARVCKQVDVGCQGYTEVGGGVGGEIPATLNATDYCPNSCVGYAEYRKMPSAFDLTANIEPSLNDPNDDTVAYFVPKSAGICSAQSVGCEEFTNLESSANGGEDKAYFTYARACEKPNAQSSTYFTWEGSDVAGYQLRTWSLIRDDATNGPEILRKAGPNGLLKNPANCSESTWRSGVDSDCRQFYNEAGTPFYRYFSQTIVSSSDCRDYRKNDSNADDCSKTGGEYQSTTRTCVYKILAAQSSMCQARDASCRAYMGTTGQNSVSVFTENFTEETNTTFRAGSRTTAEVSNEALRVGDHSLKVTHTATPSSIQFTLPTTTSSLYVISFWAKTTQPKGRAVGTSAFVQLNGVAIDSVELELDWKRYEVGPFTASSVPTAVVTFIGMPNTTYFDEVSVQRLQDVVYVRKNSWVVPQECNQTAEGVPSAQAMLGCREYRDRNGAVVDVRQFSHLCKFNAIGCSAFVNTRNSESPYAQTFTLPGRPAPTGEGAKTWDTMYSGTSTIVRPADKFEYLIDEPASHCDASQESCRAFGKPTFLQTGAVSGTETVYLKDDITKYVDGSGEPSMLCRPSELFCDKFVSGPVTSFFRDPVAMGDHTCEWQDRILMEAGTTPFGTSYPRGEYSGWFIRGTQTPCYPDKVSTGNTFISEFSGSANYRGWTELCPAEQSECTEFRDPNDHTDLAHPSGRSYFFIDNGLLDKQSCNGKVDLFGGCVAFRDMTNSQLTISTKATYALSHANNDNPVSPINCVTDPTNEHCNNAGTCQNVTCSVMSLNGMIPCEGQPIDGLPNLGFNLPGLQASQTVAAYRNNRACNTDSDCRRGSASGPLYLTGECVKNNANLIVKVKLDRDCQTWLGCSSAETVYDPSQGKYVDLCTNVAVCDQLGGSSQKNFCGHYQDRRLWAEFPDILDQGLFLNGLLYSMRSTGFGDPDYSGYTMPNHFQIADYVTKPVAYDLLMERKGPVRDKYIRDYRVVAKVPLAYWGVPETGENAPGAIHSQTGPNANRATFYTDPRYPYLHLCTHLWTGQIGYYVPGDWHCYFPIESPYREAGLSVLTLDPVNPQNVQNAANAFEQLAYPELSQLLTVGFPPAECKAAPEQDSPFPNNFVKEWNTVKYPPVPETFADGYRGVNFCENGEDCTCNYRKVSYGSENKYYEFFGNPPPAGVCSGGIRDGEECMPDLPEYAPPAPPVDDPATADVDESQNPVEALDTHDLQRCPGGVCQEIQNVTFVRGIYGQCLQRDRSRVVGGSQENNPCLIWNPTPVLFGQSDVYHYQPQAGYLPDTNSGEYYCVAGALPPKSVMVDNGWVMPPGKLNQTSFKFSDNYVSNGDCTACSGNEVEFIDGYKAKGGSMGNWCEDADDEEFGYGEYVNRQQGRWIATGRGTTHSYAEYFIGLDEKKWAEFLYGSATGTAGACNVETGADTRTCDALNERNFSFFKFDPLQRVQHGVIGCGYSADWVDGVSVSNYNTNSELRSQSRAWHAAFNQDFQSVMRADSANFLRNEEGTELQKVPCFYEENKNHELNEDGRCYYKYWQLDYRAEGQDAFKMQWDGRGGPQKFSNESIYYETSQASKAFFSIRAMFEDMNKTDNARASDDNMPSDGSKLVGPFRFVGFWVTATVPGTDSERAIYMSMTVGHADICREVAQVVSPDTRDATAFLDRVSEGSGYNLPVLGYSFGSTNIPFGSAMHAQPIGRSPLYQTDGPVPGSGSKLRPSAWIASGEEFVNKGGTTPTGNWAWVTNLFARVYRVYRWYDRAVTTTDWACVDGPQFGKWCPTSDSRTSVSAILLSREYCGYSGTCDTTRIDIRQAQPRCNGLSGVNAGLSCSGDEGDPIGGYHVCHNAPVKMVNGQLTPQYTACELQSGWTQEGTVFYHNGGDGLNRQQAQDQGGMRCASNAVRYPDGLTPKCSVVTALSQECPLEVRGGRDSECEEGHCTNGYEHSQCTTDTDCRFTWREWWNNNRDFPRAYGAANGGNRAMFATAGTQYLGPSATMDRPHNGMNYGSIAAKTGSIPWWNGAAGVISTDGVGEGRDIAMKNFNNPEMRYVLASPSTGDIYRRLERFPGAYVAIDSAVRENTTGPQPSPIPPGIIVDDADAADPVNVYIPGHCERPPVTLNVSSANLDQPPYDSRRYTGPAWTPGVCEGGSNEGMNCSNSQDCRPVGLTPAMEVASNQFCAPVSDARCIDRFAPAGSAQSRDLDTDNNLCTHNAGYYPRADLCGNNMSRQQCLTAYSHSNLATVGTETALTKPPTDVTSGLYTLDYLARINLDADRFSAFDQRYTSYYTPVPPTVAAPDTRQACPSAGQCPIAKVQAFSFENQTEGSVSYIGGQAITNIRFYAWAADNQGPLKDVLVDWGDGMIQEFHDAKMKNKKPFCGVSNQCELVPGLTCRSDNDCPPAAGKCVPTGFCRSRPTLTCVKDSDCQNGLKKDTCVVRTTFGNTDEACEQNYFEYSHAYTCSQDVRTRLAPCGSTRRCSRDTSRTCTTSAQCAPGDSCLGGLAPKEGCFDAANNACRFTPRVMVKDSWGWCTGECRTQDLGGGTLGAGFTSYAFSLNGRNVLSGNSVLFTNGGCYDGTGAYDTRTTSNIRSVGAYTDGAAGVSVPITNTCDANFPLGPWRPWLIYPGALQLGVSP